MDRGRMKKGIQKERKYNLNEEKKQKTQCHIKTTRERGREGGHKVQIQLWTDIKNLALDTV